MYRLKNMEKMVTIIITITQIDYAHINLAEVTQY